MLQKPGNLDERTVLIAVPFYEFEGLKLAKKRLHGLALVARRRDSPLAASLLDISARSAIPSQGWANPGPVRTPLAKPLREDEFVISTDEKTSIQARIRIHPSLPTEPRKTMRVEHDYARGGAWAYLAALDVHRAKVFDRWEATTGIEPFERLVEQVMRQAPYNTARRVFWVMDNVPRPRWRGVGTAPYASSPTIGAGSRPGPRELAKPDRNLLLNYPAQGSDSE